MRARIAAAAGIVALALLAVAGSAAAATPACFGAAARDPLHPCTNPTRSVVPSIEDAESQEGARCKPIKETPSPVCTFGASAARARSHVALVGDSHALHWRTTLDGVARVMRWRGYSVTAPGCFYSAAVESLPIGLREPCVDWYRDARAWFRRHSEVSTVFVSQNALTPVVVEPGTSYGAIKVAGFQRAWKALPRTVKHVVVIRDTPLTSDGIFECLRAVLAAGTELPGPACPIARAFGLRWDTAQSAVIGLRSLRYRFVDLTEFFCGPKICDPVIGGVLVHADVYGHITVTYGRTLTPYFLRKVRRLAASW